MIPLFLSPFLFLQLLLGLILLPPQHPTSIILLPPQHPISIIILLLILHIPTLPSSCTQTTHVRPIPEENRSSYTKVPTTLLHLKSSTVLLYPRLPIRWRKYRRILVKEWISEPENKALALAKPQTPEDAQRYNQTVSHSTHCGM